MLSRDAFFIGRLQELQHIDSRINAFGTFHVVCIEGEGGVGKTRLLQQVLRIYGASSPALQVCEIVDFDERALQSPQNLGFRLAERVGLKYFKQYRTQLEVYQILEKGGLAHEQLITELDKVIASWKQDLNNLTEDHRVVFLLDTFDALKAPARSYLRRLLTSGNLNNVLFLITGRNNGTLHTFYTDLSTELGNKVEILPLPRFDDSEAKQYLDADKASYGFLIELDPSLSEKVLLLAGGSPILISLAVQWRSRLVELEWLNQISLSALKALSEEERDKSRKAFEKQLVLEFGENRAGLDILTQALAHVYPLYIELICDLLGLSRLEAEQRYRQATEHVFVKVLPDGGLSLHDEMRRMVNDYVSGEYDPSKEERQRLSGIAAKYFGTRVAYLEKNLADFQEDSLESVSTKQALVEELEVAVLNWVQHALYRDVDTGFQVYQERVEQVRQARKTSLLESVQEVGREFATGFTEYQKYYYDLTTARILYYKGEAKLAKEHSEMLLQVHQGNVEREADLLNLLAACEVQLGNLDAALKYQFGSYERACILNRFIASSADFLGRIYRMLGRLDKAIFYYEVAREECLNEAIPKRSTIAGNLNNLSYALSLAGRYAEAKTYAQQAVDLWEEAKLEKYVGLGEITLATIYRDSGDYDRAVDLLNSALTRFELPDDHDLFTRAYFHRGWTQWFKAAENQHQGQLEFGLLKEARHSFEESLRLAQKYNNRLEMPGIMHQASNVYWLLGDKETARRLNEEAYELSKEMHDIRYAIDSLVGKAEYNYADGLFKQIPDYADELWADYEANDYHFPLFYGRMRRILADVAYAEGEYETALKLYAKGIGQIAQHGGWGMYYLDREWFALEKKIAGLPTDVGQAWLSYLKSEWAGQEPLDKLAVLITKINEQLVRLKLRE